MGRHHVLTSWASLGLEGKYLVPLDAIYHDGLRSIAEPVRAFQPGITDEEIFKSLHRIGTRHGDRHEEGFNARFPSHSNRTPSTQDLALSPTPISRRPSNRDLLTQERANRYAREKIPVADLHPDLQFTRLGAVLRNLATEESDAGAIAHAALSQHPDGELDLTPFRVLGDWMQDHPDHPYARRFRDGWARTPDHLALTQDLRVEIGRENQKLPAHVVHDISPYHFGPSYHNLGGGLKAGVLNVRRRLAERHPWATEQDITDAAKRLELQGNRKREYDITRNPDLHGSGALEGLVNIYHDRGLADDDLADDDAERYAAELDIVYAASPN